MTPDYPPGASTEGRLPGWRPPHARLYPVPPNRGRPFGICCLTVMGLFLITMGAAGVKVHSLLKSAAPVGASPLAARACTPLPCAKVDGLVLQVTGVNRTATAPEPADAKAGYHFVVVNVRFHNAKQTSPALANPLDFALQDSTGTLRPLEFLPSGAGCPRWQPVTLTPGADLQTQKICFVAGGSPTGALTLVWNPVSVQGNVAIPLK